jgi:hypothetical protein
MISKGFSRHPAATPGLRAALPRLLWEGKNAPALLRVYKNYSSLQYKDVAQESMGGGGGIAKQLAHFFIYTPFAGF